MAIIFTKRKHSRKERKVKRFIWKEVLNEAQE